jgi:hypothetical protein
MMASTRRGSFDQRCNHVAIEVPSPKPVNVIQILLAPPPPIYRVIFEQLLYGFFELLVF